MSTQEMFAALESGLCVTRPIGRFLMNNEIKEKWCEALESGHFKQGTGALCGIYDGEERYCCLGVLCEITGIKKGKFSFYLNKYEYVFDDYERGRNYIPDNFMGVNSDQIKKLSVMNDDGKNFAEIAAYIRENL